MKTMINGTTYISLNTLENSKMRFLRVVHVQANMMNSISNVRVGESEILKATFQIVV